MGVVAAPPVDGTKNSRGKCRVHKNPGDGASVIPHTRIRYTGAVYYNENNKFNAQWLRELIRKGAIAPGDVDESSIEDVKPADLAGYTQCHFFAGIGTWSYVLRRAGWPDDRQVWTGSCPCQPYSKAGKRGC